MSHTGPVYRGKSALELIEESVHALRTSSLPVLAIYFVGVLPFVLGFLFFWSEMTRSSFALDRSVGAALGMALLYFWMKIWQSIYCRKLLQQWTSESTVAALPARRWARYAMAQIFLHATAAPVLVLAVCLFIPFGWVYAFYQNLTVLGFARDFGKRPTRGLFDLAARQSNYAARQNHALIFAGFLFSIFVWLNIYTVLFALPFLLKKLTGIESVFTTSPFAAYLNTTFFAVTFAIAFVCVGLLSKTAYTLRCFYGLSATTGADLRMRLGYLRARRGARPGAAAVLALAAALALGGGSAPEARAVTGEELDASIEREISKSEYLWRLPRERPGEGEGGPVEQFFRSLVEGIRDFFARIGEAVDDFFEWLRKWVRGKDLNLEKNPDPVDVNWESAVRGMVYVLAALVLLVILLVVARAVRQRRRMREEADALGAVAAEVDLESEEILASQLPEDEWMDLARQQIERGELRLAVRALFLASLASLGEKELLNIEKSKSNLDYQMELARRARSEDGLLRAFADNVGIFERSWYGLHEVTREIVDVFRGNYERITAHV